MPVSYEVGRTGPARVWRLLTDGEGYSRWNPTVVSLRGRIAGGEKIELFSTVNAKRRFVRTVPDVEPERQMAWSSGLPLGPFRGVRTFALERSRGAETQFSMREEYSGMLAPLIARTIPDMTEAFGQFADGLKVAAEAGAS